MTSWPKARPRAPRRRYTGPSPRVLDLVRARCGGRCERCAAPLSGGDPHHRIPRGMGGTRDARVNQASGIVALCRPCHSYVESWRASASVDGWLVARGSDLTRIPIRSDLHGLVLLADDGSVTAVGTLLDTVAEATDLGGDA